MRKYAENIRKYYEFGLWSDKQVRDAVEKKKLTAEEYREITGRNYE